jgi:hypothetical protein
VTFVIDDEVSMRLALAHTLRCISAGALRDFTRKSAIAQIGVIRCDTRRQPPNEGGNATSFLGHVTAAAIRARADRTSGGEGTARLAQ